MMVFFFILFIINGFLLILAVYNYLSAPCLENKSAKFKARPLVSILIPARNEETNIGACLDSLSELNYGNYEVIVLDDLSEDGTGQIIDDYVSQNKKIRKVTGKPLPEGWLGKNYACFLLSKQAKGDILLFIDADVRLKNNSLDYSVKCLQGLGLSLLSSFPTQVTGSFGEYIITPLMNWLLLTFLPLKKVYESPNAAFTAANGQFMMFSSKAYFSLGGHQAVKDKVVEDMEIARLHKKQGLRIMTALGGDAVYCRMYKDFSSAYKGFVKNYFPGFGINATAFIGLNMFFAVNFFLPFVLVFYNGLFSLILFQILLQRYLISKLSGQKTLPNMILHPLQMIAAFLIGLGSVYLNLTGKIKWKGRIVSPQKSL